MPGLGVLALPAAGLLSCATAHNYLDPQGPFPIEADGNLLLPQLGRVLKQARRES